MIRLAILVSHPIQYFSPLYRALAQQPEIDLTVLYCSRMGLGNKFDPGFGELLNWDVPLLEGYESKFLRNDFKDSGPLSFFQPLNTSVIWELSTQRYDVLWVHGHFLLTNWLAMIMARVVGTKVLLRSESNLENLKRDRFSFFLRRNIIRLLFKTVDGFLYIGTRNKAYLKEFQVPDSRLFFVPYTVDNQYFQKLAEFYVPTRKALQEKFGILDDRPVILFIGKLIEKKQPLLLLEAFRRLRLEQPCAMLIVGNGDMRLTIENMIVDKQIPDVKITGFINQSEIAQAYVSSNVLVLPSGWGETWGLVINEGMNFRLPIVASDQVGCTDDLVKPGENGYLFDHRSVDDLVDKLRTLLSDREKLAEFGQRSFDIIRYWSIENCVNGALEALTAVIRDINL
jgi:glycosyltransferase involved in cell wall biosynthesis